MIFYKKRASGQTWGRPLHIFSSTGTNPTWSKRWEPRNPLWSRKHPLAWSAPPWPPQISWWTLHSQIISIPCLHFRITLHHFRFFWVWPLLSIKSCQSNQTFLGQAKHENAKNLISGMPWERAHLKTILFIPCILNFQVRLWLTYSNNLLGSS